MSAQFHELLSRITRIGRDHHSASIVANTLANAPLVRQSIREIEPTDKPVLIVSAGPSLYREKMLPRLYGKFKGLIVATDGAYVQCLRAGIIPDYVLTLDPHPTRMVRWFGDPQLAEHLNGDDYFSRQDLDTKFREDAEATNAQNISLVDHYAGLTKFVVSTTAPQAVVSRLAGKSLFWFVPLVDDPEKGALTAQMVEATGLPAMNTGGTVGTAAWVFVHSVLRSPKIAVIGMDMGYYMDTPFNETQSWNMLKDKENVAEFYPHHTGPWGESYTDPTYWWYRLNFLDLVEAAGTSVVNCSEHGLLCDYEDRLVKPMKLEEWLASCS